jgi:hypothetical protein
MDSQQESFRAYLDESEDSTTGTYVVGGFVGKAEVWSKLEPEWLACLPNGITSFHTTECFAGEGQFEGLDIPVRISLLDRLTDVILAHEVWLIGYGIDVFTYTSFASKSKENAFLRNKYAAPFGGAVQLACECMGNSPGPEDIWKVIDEGERWERCAFFIESNEYSPSANRTITEMRNARDLWFRQRIGTETYGTKSGATGIPLLQVADLGAFLAAKQIAKSREGKISWKPYYERLTKGQRCYRMVLADKHSLKVLHETHEELKTEAAEGRHYWDDL